MTLKLNTSIALPGMRGSNFPSAQLPNGVTVAEGYELYPGEAAYWADGSGKTVRPPLANSTYIKFSAAPGSGDTISATVNGVAYSFAFSVDAPTTMAGLKTEIEAQTANIASVTVGDTNTSLTILAKPGKQAIVTAAANSDGTTTDKVTHRTTDTFAFLVTRDRSEAINGVHKFTEKMLVSGVQRGDSVSCYVGGGESDTYDINADVLVRLLASGSNRPGQIMCGDPTDTDPSNAAVEPRLSFSGEGDAGNYEYVYVKEQ